MITNKPAPLLALTIGAVLRLAVWAPGLWNDSWVLTDTLQYWALSSNALAGYRTGEGLLFEWSLARPPGYPIILAGLRAVHDDAAIAALLHIGFGLVTIAMTYFIARAVAGERVAAMASWLLALSPINILFASTLLTEVPFSVLLLAAIALVSPLATRQTLSLWRWALAGLAIAFATLIRPISLYLPLAVLPFVLISDRRGRVLQSTMAFLIGFTLPVGGWIARNHESTGVPIFSTIEGFNMAYYRAAGAIAVDESIPIDDARKIVRRFVDAESPPGANPAETARVEARVGAREILRHPRGAAISTIRGLVYTLVGPARGHFLRRFQNTPVAFLAGPAAVASAGSAAILTIGSLLGALLWIRSHDFPKLFLLGIPILYLLAIGSGQESWARFRVPIEPLLAPLAAVAFLRAGDILRSPRG